MDATYSFVGDSVRLLDERGLNDPPLLDEIKISNWDPFLKTLGRFSI